MNLTFGLVTLILSVLIAFSAAKDFWSAPLEMLQKQSEADINKVAFEEVVVASVTPVPTPTPTSTSTSTTTTTSFDPCINGCIPTIGTANGPVAPPPFNTNYNGRNPVITSYPTTQP